MALKDFREEAERCSRCSLCKWVPMDQVKGHDFSYVCPSISRFNFHCYSAGGRLNIALSMMDGRIDYTDNLLEIIYRCQLCGACDVSCKYTRDMEPLETMRALRLQCVEDGQVIPEHTAMIESLKKDDNTMERPKADRGKWAEGLDVKDITQEKAEVVYHAGCRYSYDKELWGAARGAVNILKQAGVDLGIAGKAEACCGGRVYDLGYKGELTKYADNNMELFRGAGVKTLVTSCADGYFTFKVLYDKFNKKDGLEVLHITEYLARLLKEGKLKLTKKVPMTVTYHDPCHLGRIGERFIRWQGQLKRDLTMPVLYEPPKEFMRGTYGVYEPPREVIKGIPGMKLVEMTRIKEYSWCCGAAGGVKETYPDFALWTALERIREAKSTGAEALVSACPWCKNNFTDAIKESGDKIKVYDIVEIIQQAI